MWITCLDPVSADSENGIGSQWAVRVGRDCSRDSGKAEQPESWFWYIVEASLIRGGFQNT